MLIWFLDYDYSFVDMVGKSNLWLIWCLIFMSTWLSSLISQFVATHVIMRLQISVIRSTTYVVGRYAQPIDYSEMTRMWTVYIHQV